MARKYEYRTGHYGWGMEQCEEQLLIAAFHEIEPRIPPGQGWKDEFLDNFYQSGLGVTFETIDRINAERRRQILETIEFIETNVYEYSRLKDRVRKADLRRQMRDEFSALDTAGKIRWKHDAADQTARLCRPHHTFAEVKAWRETRSDSPALTTQEQARRMQAFERPTTPDRAKSEIVSLAIRQLRLAKKPDTIQKIIALLTPDDALAVAESDETEDPEIIDALVVRSLGCDRGDRSCPNP